MCSTDKPFLTLPKWTDREDGDGSALAELVFENLGVSESRKMFAAALQEHGEAVKEACLRACNELRDVNGECRSAILRLNVNVEVG